MAKGYDNDPIMQDLLLDLQFKEGTGTVTNDWAKPHHADPTITTATWTDLDDLPMLDFTPGTPDWIEIAVGDTADLNFTTGAFSLSMWFNVDDISDGRTLFCRGLASTDGWFCYVDTSGAVQMVTAQAAAQQLTDTADAAITVSTWYNVIITRATTDILIYINGVDATATAGTHTDPLTSARGLHLGILDNETDDPYDGHMWRPMIWGRTLLASEALEFFERHRDKFSI